MQVAQMHLYTRRREQPYCDKASRYIGYNGVPKDASNIVTVLAQTASHARQWP